MSFDDVAHLDSNELLPGPPLRQALAKDGTRRVGEPRASSVSPKARSFSRTEYQSGLPARLQMVK